MTRRPEVPSKDYALQYRALLPELAPELARVLLEEEPILGASVERFEQEWAACCGTAHAVGVNSGTDALCLALRAGGIGPGDEVITSAHTFLATVTAIVMAGARPVLVDPDPETMLLTAERIAAAVGPRTRAVLVVHLYGCLCPMAEIVALCCARGVPLLEDAAQAHGARDAKGRCAGAFGLAGCFSFHPSKNLGAFGDAGAVTTDDPALAAQVRTLRHLGKVSKHEAGSVAPNAKLDTLQAAILRVKLPRLEAWNQRRRHLAGLYRARLHGIGDLRLPHDPGGELHVWHQYVVRTGRREALRAFLAERGVHAGVHYPIPPHLQRFARDLGYRQGQLPVAEECARTVLSLSISPELTDAQVELVCERIRAFF